MIEPMDIKHQKFKKGLLGYKTSDVEGFVNTVYKAYEEVYDERNDLENKLEKVNATVQECRLKIFDLENQLNKSENVSSYGDDDNAEAKKKADAIIKNAEAAAAEIIAKAKEQSKTIESGAKPQEVKEEVKEETSSPFRIKGQAAPKATKPAEEVKESASSKFFKKVAEEAPAAKVEEDDDEIFVGEIEDARKPDRMMIGDGEEEEDMDFEFL